MKSLTRISFALVIAALTISCSNFDKLMKGNDFAAQYEAAVNYYNERSYTRATQLFENLIMHYHGKEHAEDISWYYAMSLMNGDKDYYSAGYQFKSFFKRFPYSERAEEALFLSATCKYNQSPEYFLDQKLTKEAISEYESFVDRYPGSVHIPEINARLDELRNKLMQKEYDIAYSYYLTEQYNAAYVSLQAFLNDYPESQFREQAMFYMLASGYEYGINSTDEKMRERLQQVVNDFDRFAAAFRDSEYLAQAQELYTKSKAALSKIE